ncbi:hypothetical protein EMQ25_10680 [Arsenicitalea aurantiaca]|uniref:Resolvase/invertase-type recombinase catalytic domain-containing protein n=1 Tax=Arsenicitalea aurantiaca TaxID=1783274 RepID=A0A433XB38_9HYPH|nr:helix-turn-helix domain-containing protein [Arsenicitalea aurantiaca]RUT31311.1 hypothetical protein EMQ25_10680 [Arsenicitalea aurantiaca]
MQVGYLHGGGPDGDIVSAVAALEAFGCGRVVIDSRARRQAGSGTSFSALLGDMRSGDILVVTTLEHLATAVGPLVLRLEELVARGIRIRTLDGDFDTETPGTAGALKALARIAAHHNGARRPVVGRAEHGPGRPPRLSPEEIGRARELFEAGGRTAAEVARQLGVSRATLYRSLRKLGPTGA